MHVGTFSSQNAKSGRPLKNMKEQCPIHSGTFYLRKGIVSLFEHKNIHKAGGTE